MMKNTSRAFHPTLKPIFEGNEGVSYFEEYASLYELAHLREKQKNNPDARLSVLGSQAELDKDLDDLSATQCPGLKEDLASYALFECQQETLGRPTGNLPKVQSTQHISQGMLIRPEAKRGEPVFLDTCTETVQHQESVDSFSLF